jgi:hypothetical protein
MCSAPWGPQAESSGAPCWLGGPPWGESRDCWVVSFCYILGRHVLCYGLPVVVCRSLHLLLLCVLMTCA